MKILKLLLLGVCVLTFCHEASAEVITGNRIMDQPMTENLCALTFDDGPSPFTPQLLDMLAKYKIPATFFMLGSQARNYPEIVKRASREGHEIANHSWSHPNLRALSAEKQAAQIIETDALLRSLGGAPVYLRPPYGSFDERTEKIAEQLGLSLILWSMDSKDWKRLPENYAKVFTTRGTVYEDGEVRGIFLFHDIHQGTVDDFPRIVNDLRNGGCDRFVTISEFLSGIADPEPALAMTRRPAADFAPPLALALSGYPAGSGPTPLLRCSKPWTSQDNDLAEIHASAAPLEASTVMAH